MEMKKRCISLYVENQIGVLAKISGLFAGKSYNLDTLTVGETEDPTVSRMTIEMTMDDVTFEQVKKEVRELSDSHGKYREHATKYYRDLGQITHYIADYFTFPHNRTYPGNLKDHCSYEEVLKLRLREYLKTDKKDRWPFVQCHFGSAEALCDFIKLRHEEYLRRKIDVEEDIRHIVSLNYQVVEGIRQLAEQGKLHQYLSKKRAA